MQPQSPLFEYFAEFEWPDQIGGFDIITGDDTAVKDFVPDGMAEMFFPLVELEGRGIFALWLIADSEVLDEHPVALIPTNDDAPIVVAPDLRTFFSLMHYGTQLASLLDEMDDHVNDFPDGPDTPELNPAHLRALLDAAAMQYPDLKELRNRFTEDLGIHAAENPYAILNDALMNFPDPDFGDEEE